MANSETIKATIDANINTNGNQAITGAVMNSVLKQMVEGLSESLSIYQEPYEKEPIQSSEVQGRVALDTKQLTITASNWTCKMFPVTKGQTVKIKSTIKPYTGNFASIAFIDEYVNYANAQVVRDFKNVGTFEDYYTVKKDGYILVLYNIAGVQYVTDLQVLNLGYKFIDYNQEISTVKKSVVSVKNDIDALDAKLSIYKVHQDTPMQPSQGHYRSLISTGTLEVVGDNYVAYHVPVIAGNTYKVKCENAGYPSKNIFALVYYQEGELVVGGKTSIIQSVDGIRNYDVKFSPAKDGVLFVQQEISEYSWDVEILESVPGDEFEDFGARIEELSSALGTNPVAIRGGEKIYAVVGDTLQVFYRSLVECVDINNYYIHCTAPFGKSYPRYFEYTPQVGDEGEFNLTVQVYGENGLVAEKTFTVIVSDSPSSPNTLLNVATFGDSLSSAGEWQNEVGRRFKSNDVVRECFPAGDNLSNIAFVGSMNQQYANYFGIGGWAWVNYATEGTFGWRFYVTGVDSLSVGSVYSVGSNQYIITEVNVTNGTGNILTRQYNNSGEPLSSGTLTRISGVGDKTISYSSVVSDSPNPLWVNGKLTYVPYINQCTENNNVDYIVFLLGWNILYVGLEPNVAYIESLVNKAHEEYPLAKVVLMGVQLPSLNGGLAANYAPTSLLSNKYGLIKMVHAYNAFLEDICSHYDYVEYLDVASQFDSENNMPEQEHQVNVRNDKRELRGTNGVHPGMAGYCQIADVFYRYLCSQL